MFEIVNFLTAAQYFQSENMLPIHTVLCQKSNSYYQIEEKKINFNVRL